MTLSEFITRVNYALRGTDDDAPTIGDDDWVYWTSVLNRKKDELTDEKNYQSNFNDTPPNAPGTVATTGTTALVGTSTNFLDYQIGDKITVSGETERTILTITDDTHLTVSVAFANTASAKTFTRKIIIKTGVQVYNLHRRFVEPADDVQVLLSNGTTYQTIDIIKPQERDRTVQEAFITSRNPKQLNLTYALLSTDPIVGGTLWVPGFYRPDDVDATSATAVLPIDDPNWAVMAVAAQVAFNDITYEDKFPDLNGQANELFKQMNRRNRRGSRNNPRKPTVKVFKIPGFK